MPGLCRLAAQEWQRPHVPPALLVDIGLPPAGSATNQRNIISEERRKAAFVATDVTDWPSQVGSDYLVHVLR